MHSSAMTMQVPPESHASTIAETNDSSDQNGPKTSLWKSAAIATISALASHGFHSCLFGSAACAAYGMKHREPNDVDIVVLTNKHPEEIKAFLVSTSTQTQSWYLVPPRNSYNNYKILWFCQLPGLTPASKIKVDILTPGLLSIPPVPLDRLVMIPLFLPSQHEPDNTDRNTDTALVSGSVPVMPILALIFLKLRGWTDHLASHVQRFQEKTWVDEDDINEMIHLAVETYGVTLHGETEGGNDGDTLQWMPDWFVEEGFERVEQYSRAFPESLMWWDEMGFQLDTEDEECWGQDDLGAYDDDYDD